MANYTFKNLGQVGRLGNQMFQIAWAYTQSLHSGTSAFIRPNWEYRHVFSVPKALYESPRKGACIDGGTEYYQDITLWKGKDEEVRQIFQPSYEASERVAEYVGTNNLDNGCAVHYRRGDYLKHPKNFPIPTPGYYSKAMGEVLEKNSDTIFYVFSDDSKMVQREYKSNPAYRLFRDRTVFFEGTVTPVEVIDRKGEPLDWLDLFAMQGCSTHIIANSTFSWWGGFLSDNREVIYPSTWFGVHPSCRNIPWRLMIPNTWKEFKC